jgi:hypothetical protein
MKKGIIFLILLSAIFEKNGTAQILMTDVYTQNFGTTDITSWANNSTFTGWYIESTGGTPLTFNSHLNITSTAAPSNAGAYYSYECNSDNNQKIGTRPSNGAGGPGVDGNGNDLGVYIGARFKNNSGVTCTSIKVTYTGYQLSLSENGNNVNKYKFSYKTSAGAITSLVGTGWTAVSALDYTAPNNNASSGSNQISAYQCNVSTDVSGCFSSGLNIPNGSEIMLRWGDKNDAANDPHIAIDNVTVEFFRDNVCFVVLPIELLDFYGTKNNDGTNQVVWKVVQEENINYYTIEKSNNGIDFTVLGSVVPSVNYASSKSYSLMDETPFNDITYYRLSTKERDGSAKYYQIISVDEKSSDWNYTPYQNNDRLIFEFKNSVPKNSQLSIYDLSGKLIVSEQIHNYLTSINVQTFSSGIYIAKIETPYKTENFKLVISN